LAILPGVEPGAVGGIAPRGGGQSAGFDQAVHCLPRGGGRMRPTSDVLPHPRHGHREGDPRPSHPARGV